MTEEGVQVGQASSDLRRQEIIDRLKRVEGQIRGIQRMIEEDKKCADILDQVAAARSALYSASLLILENYTKECLIGAVENAEGIDGVVDDLVKVMKKFAG